MDQLQIGISLEDLLTQFLAFLPNLISGIVIFLLTLYGSAWFAKSTGRAMERRDHDPELILLISRLVRWCVLILGTVQALAQVNFDVTSLVAGLGIAGFTLGFALQDVAKNFVAGILLLLQQPFSIGDAIEVAGFNGKVLDITLRTTELRTWDGRNVLIPNGDVYVKPIVNFSRSNQRRLQLTISLSQAGDLTQVTQLVLGALGESAGTLDDPAPEAVWTKSAATALDLSAYYWVDTLQVDLREALNGGVKIVQDALLKEGEGLNFTIKAGEIDGR